jgi:hypothetical protein
MLTVTAVVEWRRLLAVVAAWPALPSAIKAGIVAMVKASKGRA